MPTFFLMLLLLTFPACSSAATPDEQIAQTAATPNLSALLNEEQLGEFAELIEQTRAANNIPGVAAAIVRGDEMVFAEGFGVRNMENGELVTPETLFHIGSTHKSMTAMLLAILVDEDLLEWDTPVIEIYPDFDLSDPEATEAVTVRHLLSMSSGIPGEAEDTLGADIEVAEDVFALLPEISLIGQPGSRFSYSNISTSVAGYVGVLVADSQSEDLYAGYDRLLQSRIFAPIGMKTATLAVEEAWANPNHSASHILDDGEVVVAESYDFTGDPLAPSGSIKASAIDMALYLGTQIGRGVAPNGTRVVSEQNLIETWQPQIVDDESGGHYGMGWGVQSQDGADIVWHEGSYDNFSSLLMFLPEANVGMVLLTNLDDPGDFLEVVSESFIQLSE